MPLLYLKLSPHIVDDPLGRVVLGLSIDERPSRQARARGRWRAMAISPQQARRSVTTHTQQERTVTLKVRTPRQKELETVALTISGAPTQGHAAVLVNLDITLAPNWVLTIKSTMPKVSLMITTPVLARMATQPSERCQALRADTSRCRLMKRGPELCFFHREHLHLLHDTELEKRKPWYTIVKGLPAFRGDDNQMNINGYNIIQESLALRNIITQILYAGNEDQRHRDFVRTTRQCRDNVGQQLRFNKSDGTGRVSITSCIDPFLALAAETDTNPRSIHNWDSELKVNLRDVREVLQYQGDGPTPSVYQLFSAPGSTAMRDILFAKAHEMVDLPDLPEPRKDKDPRDMTHEEAVRHNAANGFPPPQTKEQENDWNDYRSIWDENGEPSQVPDPLSPEKRAEMDDLVANSWDLYQVNQPNTEGGTEW